MYKLSSTTSNYLNTFNTKEELDSSLQHVFKRGVEVMLEAELHDHLGYGKYSYNGINSGNSRNGKKLKTIKTIIGKVATYVPRDRKGTFEPVLLPKRNRSIERVGDMMLALYSRGVSINDIEQQVRQIYGDRLNAQALSTVSRMLVEDIINWHQQTLEETYLMVWMDKIHLTVVQNNTITYKTAYVAIGVNANGVRNVLSIWLTEIENRAYWSKILSGLKERGVTEIMIACCDDLEGLLPAYKDIFPLTVTQLSVANQIKNAIKMVSYSDREAFITEMKQIYDIINFESAQLAVQIQKMENEMVFPHQVA